MVKSKSRALMNGISAVIKEAAESMPHFYLMKVVTVKCMIPLIYNRKMGPEIREWKNKTYPGSMLNL